MLRYIALLLLILLLALEVKLWTGDWSMREVWRLRQRVSEQKLDVLAAWRPNARPDARSEAFLRGG